MMKTLLSHPTGNANVRSAALGLFEANLLVAFHTTIATYPGSILDNLSKFKPLSELNRRRFDAKLAMITTMHPWFEVGRMLATKAGMSSLTRHEYGKFCIDAVYEHLDVHVEKHLMSTSGLQAIYAYEDGALNTFKAAKKSGLACFYDLPIGYWRVAHRLMELEKEKWPEWSATLTGIKNSEAKLAKKDEELRMADRILVASSFTANTLKDFPETIAPVNVIPYGFPPVNNSRVYDINLAKQPLKLLFVGGLSQRKGIANLFEAVNGLGSLVQLTVVGRKASNDCPALDAALKKHRWIPTLPHEEVLKLMRKSDVLVFPSLFEGFGLVITEAMSQGTPVITTERTAGPDLINHGENGWLVEAGSTEELRKAIELLLNNPDQIVRAGQSAMKTALNRPWSVYGQQLAAALNNHLL